MSTKGSLQHLNKKCNFITAVATSLCMPHSWSLALHLSLTRSFLLTIITVSPFLSHSLFPFLSPSPISPLSQSITHSDSLCNMPSSKLNSTLLDLQPFPSSKWLTSVITLLPEWETQRRGREGWVADRDMTWEERKRRFNYSYLLQQKESKRGKERKRGIDPNGKVFLGQQCTLGAKAVPPWGHGCEGTPPLDLREEHTVREGGRERVMSFIKNQSIN